MICTSRYKIWFIVLMAFDDVHSVLYDCVHTQKSEQKKERETSSFVGSLPSERFHMFEYSKKKFIVISTTFFGRRRGRIKKKSSSSKPIFYPTTMIGIYPTYMRRIHHVIWTIVLFSMSMIFPIGWLTSKIEQLFARSPSLCVSCHAADSPLMKK